MVLWIPRQDVGIDEGIRAGSMTVSHTKLTTYWNRDTLFAGVTSGYPSEPTFVICTPSELVETRHGRDADRPDHR